MIADLEQGEVIIRPSSKVRPDNGRVKADTEFLWKYVCAVFQRAGTRVFMCTEMLMSPNSEFWFPLMHVLKGILNLPTSSLHLSSPFQQNR